MTRNGRSRGLTAGAALATTLAATAALAQEAPPLAPTRDAELTYRATGDQPGQTYTLHVDFKAGGQLLRVDPPGMPGYYVLDRANRQMTEVLTRDHVYMQGPMPSGAADYLSLSPDMHFTRIGSATVAGQPCVVWQMQATDGNGTGCVTADGVILRASGSDVKGQKGGVDALTVSYHPLPDSLFGPPPGFRRVSPPGQGAPPGQVAPPGQAAPPGQP